MRKQFFIPVMVGMLALSAAQAFAQSGTVVMRNGDRVQAEVRDMGQNISLRVNGQPRQVPIGDIVLIDFTGNGRDISRDELSQRERGEWLRRDEERRNVQRVSEGPDWRPAHCDLHERAPRQSRRGLARLSRVGQQRAGLPAGGQSDDSTDGSGKTGWARPGPRSRSRLSGSLGRAC